MRMRFRIDTSTDRRPTSSVLLYRPEEYSFDTEPAPSGAFTSVLVDDLNLEIDEGGRIVSIWGMCPHTRWISAPLVPPTAQPGDVYFVADGPISKGVSIPLNHGAYLPVQADRKSGWVRIQGEGAPDFSVEPLGGVIFEITGEGQLCSLWLKSRGEIGG
jgi:hypothetical protein